MACPYYIKFRKFRKEGFNFPDLLEFQDLTSLVYMKGAWYPDLVEVFYHNLRFENGIMKSRVKGVNIEIDDFIWMLFTGLEENSALSHLPNSELNAHLKKKELYSNWRRYPEDASLQEKFSLDGLKKEEMIIAHILSWIILPRRIDHNHLTIKNIYLMHAIINKIPTNWIEVIKNHMRLATFKNSPYLSYAILIRRILLVQGLILSDEKSWCCDYSNEINNGTLEEIGMKKTSIGWFFEDEPMFSPKTKFEIFVANQLKTINVNMNVDETSQPQDECSTPEEISTKSSETG